jgi:hypothetical protein
MGSLISLSQNANILEVTKQSGGGGGDMEARIAKLESDVEHIKTDVSEIKTDIRHFFCSIIRGIIGVI